MRGRHLGDRPGPGQRPLAVRGPALPGRRRRRGLARRARGDRPPRREGRRGPGVRLRPHGALRRPGRHQGARLLPGPLRRGQHAPARPRRVGSTVTVTPADGPNTAPEPPTLESRVVSGDTRQGPAARQRRRPRRRPGHHRGHHVRAPQGPAGVLRRQLPGVPGLPAHRRHRRVRVLGRGHPRRRRHRHGADRRRAPGGAAEPAGRRRPAHRRAGPHGHLRPAGQRLRRAGRRRARRARRPAGRGRARPGDQPGHRAGAGPGRRALGLGRLLDQQRPRQLAGGDDARDRRRRSTTRRSCTTPSAAPTTARASRWTCSTGPTTPTARSRTSGWRRCSATPRSRASTATGSRPTAAPRRWSCRSGSRTATAPPPPPRSTCRPPGTGIPYVKPGALIELDRGGSFEGRLDDFVVNPSGGSMRLTGKRAVSASPAALQPAPDGDKGFTIGSDADYRGPGALLLEVTTATDPNGNEDPQDPTDGYTALLSVPVQVGDDTPELECPETTIPISAGEVYDLDIGSLCNVWTLDPTDADDLDLRGRLHRGRRRALGQRQRQRRAAGERGRGRHRGRHRGPVRDGRRQQRRADPLPPRRRAAPDAAADPGRRHGGRAVAAPSTWRPTSSPGVSRPDPTVVSVDPRRGRQRRLGHQERLVGHPQGGTGRPRHARPSAS